jgi:hypothetical protein
MGVFDQAAGRKFPGLYDLRWIYMDRPAQSGLAVEICLPA